ncbi:MAG: hypothetical protein HUJ75_01605 [Parasporobacterium sp.]|nr:hypothetical protein [Parasporobacterium sp.]
MGDIYLASATADYDLGNRAHQSLLPEGRPTNWYHNPDYDDNSHKILPEETVNMAWNLIKDFKPATNEKARKFMARYNPALGRDPVVEKATFISGDTYWKGIYHHNTAKYINDFYGCPDPYRITEMEEAAVCDVLDRFGMLDRYIGLRAAVNLDDFMNGATPESVWTVSFMEALEETEGEGLGNIFELAMDNLFRAGSLIIDYLLEKK